MTARVLPVHDIAGFGTPTSAGTITINLEPTGTYDRVDLEFLENGSAMSIANMKSKLSRIDVIINGVIQRSLSASQILEAINGTRGVTAVAGKLPLFFAEPWLKSAQARASLAWGMQDVNSFQIKITYAAFTTSGNLDVKKVWRPIEQPMGVISKIYNLSQNANAGTNILSNLPQRLGEALRAIHFDSTNVTDIKVVKDDVVIVESDKVHLDSIYADAGVTVDADVLSWIADYTKELSDALPVSKKVVRNGNLEDALSSFLVQFEDAAGGSTPIIVEALGLRNAA